MGVLAAQAGFGPARQLPAVGDGAPWIAHPVDLPFATQGPYRVDFFHLCEYLDAASKGCAANDAQACWTCQKTG
jgi:hypothetical protein